MTLNIHLDEDMHRDGSPLGNGRISSGLYTDLAICPNKKCPTYGQFWKCYQEPAFTKCNTYLKKFKRLKNISTV